MQFSKFFWIFLKSFPHIPCEDMTPSTRGELDNERTKYLPCDQPQRSNHLSRGVKRLALTCSSNIPAFPLQRVSIGYVVMFQFCDVTTEYVHIDTYLLKRWLCRCPKYICRRNINTEARENSRSRMTASINANNIISLASKHCKPAQ